MGLAQGGVEAQDAADIARQLDRVVLAGVSATYRTLGLRLKISRATPRPIVVR